MNDREWAGGSSNWVRPIADKEWILVGKGKIGSVGYIGGGGLYILYTIFR